MTEEFNKILLGFRDDLVGLIPKLIMALIVLGLGYLLARLVKYLVIRLLKYIGQWIDQRFKHVNLKEGSDFLGTAFFWLILLATFLLITDILGLPIITTGIESILRYTPNILAAILILFAANVFGKLIADLISSVSIRMGFSHGKTFGRITRYLILLTAIIIVIDQIGIEVTFLINLINIVLATLLFGASLAFGLGARTSISNILATFYVRKLYREGDHIKIDEWEGRIKKIDGTFVLLDTDDGELAIPAKVFNEAKSILIKKT